MTGQVRLSRDLGRLRTTARSESALPPSIRAESDVDQHFAGIVPGAALPGRCHGVAEGFGEPEAVGQLGGESQAGMRHDAPAVGG
jgi:hypothetical protein